MDALSDLWTQIVDGLQSATSNALPPLVAGLLLLLVGWLIALVARAVVSGLLRRLGVERLAGRIGVDRALEQLGLDPSASRLLGRITYWLILLLFILAAVNRLGMEGLDQALTVFIGYLPSVLAAALILFLGVVLARFVGEAVGTFSMQAGVRGGRLVGQVVRYAILGLAVILAMDQLQLRVDFLISIVVVLIAAVALATGLAFGLGSRGLAHSIMAGFHAREAFAQDQWLQVRSHTGRLVSINAVQAVLETDEGLVSIPNTVLVEEEVTIIPQTEPVP
jgi:small-conductance mechanosensitive channel